MNPFNHIDLRVSDLSAAYAFYAKLLPAAGFPHEDSGDTWKVFMGDGRFPQKAFFGITEEAGHRPNSSRIAFGASSREEVDRLAGVVRDAGGRNLSGPKECPEYSPTYYAVFFEDPCGTKLEVCYQAD